MNGWVSLSRGAALAELGVGRKASSLAQATELVNAELAGLATCYVQPTHQPTIEQNRPFLGVLEGG
jgi:hypothetical protein